MLLLHCLLLYQWFNPIGYAGSFCDYIFCCIFSKEVCFHGNFFGFLKCLPTSTSALSFVGYAISTDKLNALLCACIKSLMNWSASISRTAGKNNSPFSYIAAAFVPTLKGFKFNAPRTEHTSALIGSPSCHYLVFSN